MAELVCPVTLVVKAASGDIAKNRFVTYTATNGAKLPAAAGEGAIVYGVNLTAHDASEPNPGAISVATRASGKVDVEAGAAIVEGAVVIADNLGRAVTTTTTAGANLVAGAYQELGIAQEAASAAGEVIEIALLPGAPVTVA